ncbi:MAG: YggS family pyridoxal phosphate-dependent enzyme [Rickettsiales bacterium]|nr:YggS family pyridoxal phosphate-dependent enzyme [Rickettsiales bacterium]
MTLADRLRSIQGKIDKLGKDNSLSYKTPLILGASKGQGLAIIEEAIAAGLTYFGENRVQEAYEKWPEIKKKHPHIQLHLIGPLQSNKVKPALELFDVIQTLDRPKLADEIAKQYTSGGSKQFFIQVNIGDEPQKSGISPKDAERFIDYCLKTLGLPVVGLMCVPPAEQAPAPHFALLKKIAGNHGLNQLSMGMSNDYETAIRMGSSCVRIGTALFGERL